MIKRTAKQEALRLLATREYFSAELKKKLVAKGFSSEDIEKAVQECQKLGLLDDERATELFVGKLKRQGNGPRLIAAKLKVKGADFPKNISIFLEDQKQAIRSLIEKKTRFQKKEPEALVRMLVRKGFALEDILQVIKINSHDF